jgi:hypothetical protein
MNLDLRIDELLLDDEWRHDRDAISEALSAHLSRLAGAAGGQPLRGRDALHIEHLVVDVAPGAGPDQDASDLAEQIWKRLRGGRR